MEKAPKGLGAILDDIDRTKEEVRVKREIDDIRREKAGNLLRQGNLLLEKCGELKPTTRWVGVGGGRIGVYSEPVGILVTPPVEVTVGGKEVVLWATEDLGGGVLLKMSDKDEDWDIFKIWSNNVKNWRGENAALDEMGIASKALSFLKDSLPEVEKSDLPHPALREVAKRFVFDSKD